MGLRTFHHGLNACDSGEPFLYKTRLQGTISREEGIEFQFKTVTFFFPPIFL